MSLSEIKIINDKIKMLEQEMEDYATKNDWIYNEKLKEE